MSRLRDLEAVASTESLARRPAAAVGPQDVADRGWQIGHSEGFDSVWWAPTWRAAVMAVEPAPARR